MNGEPGLKRILHPAVILLATACASNPQQPANQPAAPEVPSEISTITIPIRTTLAPLLPQLESQVPKSMQKLDDYELDPSKGYGLKYRVTRDPIALNMAGTGLHATVTVRYQLQGCRRTTKPFSHETTMWPCLSCGFDEPMREAFIAIDSHLEWDASWRIRSSSSSAISRGNFGGCGSLCFRANNHTSKPRSDSPMNAATKIAHGGMSE